MVVLCPKCRVKLKVDESKIAPEGKKFKCPRCSAVLVVRKPASAGKPLNQGKILVAHSNDEVRSRVVSLLSREGYEVLTAADGINAVVAALRDCPFLTIIEVGLPKIYGFEVCKRLKARAETRDMKFLLVASTYDKSKYRRQPSSLYGSDDYVEEHDLTSLLVAKVEALKGMPQAGKPAAGEVKEPVAQPGNVAPPAEPGRTPSTTSDERIERARRLARTIINDIYLYNSAKLDESVRNNNFYAAFATEIKEGQKLYDMRIPQEVRNMGNFYREAIEDFLATRKELLS